MANNHTDHSMSETEDAGHDTALMREGESVKTRTSENQNDKIENIPYIPYRVTVEPVFFVIYFALHVSDSVLIEHYLKRTCEVQLKFNSTVCDALGSNSDEGHWAEKVVQPFTADYMMWRMILQSILPAVFSVFIGPWTDSNGRKPILLSTVAGITVMYIVLTVFTWIPKLHPAYLLLGVVPVALTGGYVNLTAACYCYITDVTQPASRSFRLGLLEGSLYSGMLLGLSSSSYIFDGVNKSASGYGYASIFGCAGSACFIVLLYLVFFVPESVRVTQAPQGLKGLFNFSLPIEMAKTCIKKRPENRRAVLFLCYSASAFSTLVLDGEGQVEYLFARLRFSFDLQQWTIFSSVSMSIAVVSTVAATWLLPKIFKLSDAYLAILSFGTDIGQGVLYAVATPAQSYFLYVGAAVASLRGVVGPAVTSILSSTVPAQDVGKVFALSSSLEALTPIVAGPIYVNVYNATLNDLPGAFYLLSCGFYAVAAIFMGIIAAFQRRYKKLNQ